MGGKGDPPSSSPGGGGSAAKPTGWGDTAGRISLHRRRAAALRARAPEPEQRLWRALKELALEGSHFRRQVPIGSYVADFACLGARLIIELDGSQHARPGASAADGRRQGWLEGEGYRVLRFWNSDLTENLEGVLETVRSALYGDGDPSRFIRRRRASAMPSPHPVGFAADPPPPGEGGKGRSK